MLLTPYDNDEILWRRYENLPADMRFLADIAILIFEPVSLYQFGDFVRNLKLKHKAPNASAYSVLHKAGIINKVDSSYLKVSEKLAIRALPSLLNNQEYLHIAFKIQVEFSGTNTFFYYRPVSPLRLVRSFIYGYFTNNTGIMQDSLKLIDPNNTLVSPICILPLFI